MRKDPAGKTSVRVLVAVVVAIAVAAGIYFGVIRPRAGPDLSTPSGTFAAWVDAFNARDADAAYAFFSSQIKAQHSKTKLERYLEQVQTFGWKVSKWEVLEENITGDTAVLKIQTTFVPSWDSEPSIDNIPFIRENGDWLINERPERKGNIWIR